MVVVDNSKAVQPPYASFRTFINFLERLEQGIPQHIDRHYWGSFLSGATGNILMTSLRFLGLITLDTNEPTDLLERLVDPNQRKEILAQLLRERYAPVLADIDLARGVMGHLEQSFGRHYKLENETRRKAITFLLHAAQYAGIPLSNQLSTKTKPRQAGGRAGVRRRTATTVADGRRNQTVDGRRGQSTVQRGESSAASQRPPGNTKTITFARGGSVTVTVAVDWFEIESHEEAFLRDLIAMIRDFEQRVDEDAEEYGDDDEFDEDEA
jgi:hypothetical protein